MKWKLSVVCKSMDAITKEFGNEQGVVCIAADACAVAV